MSIYKEYKENSNNEKFETLIIYRFNSDDKPACMIWRGRQGKPYIKYKFNDINSRESYIEKEKERENKKVQEKLMREEDEREALKNYKLQMSKGSILSCSWGYEQTNVDFYEVVDVRGKAVMLQEIESNLEPIDGLRDQYKVTPDRTKKEGKVFKKIVRLHVYDGKVSESIKIADYAVASLWNGHAMHMTRYY